MEDLLGEYQLKAIWSQSPDCCSSDEDYQELHIEHCNGGGGDFFILSTKRWAFDDPEELFNLINEFIKKHGDLQRNEKKKKS